MWHEPLLPNQSAGNKPLCERRLGNQKGARGLEVVSISRHRAEAIAAFGRAIELEHNEVQRASLEHTITELRASVNIDD